jgi:hypothetical protein
VRGLYRGFGIAFLGSGPGTVAYFAAYEAAKRALAGAGPGSGAGLAGAGGHLIAGLLAEASSCVLWVPIDVIKERMQVQARGGAWYYPSARAALATIVRVEGVRGLYRGYGATLASFGPFSALYFALYEALLPPVRERLRADGASAAVAAAVAGAAASVATNPLDLAKLRLQVQRGRAAADPGGATPFQYHHTAHALAAIVREEGPAALLRGAAARVAFHVPSTALTMWLFDRCRAAAAAAVD